MKPLNLIALLLFLAGAVWALTRSDRAVRNIQAVYYRAVSPFLKAGSGIETKARSFVKEIRHSKDLEAELEVTREQLGRLRLIESRFRSLEEENIQLRNALKFKQSTRFDVVAARVVRRNPTTWWQTVEIDVGADRQVGSDLSVLCNEGLVGRIDRIGKDRSSVLLLTDEKCQVAARIEGSPEVGIVSSRRGIADGKPMLRIRFLSANSAVRPGQRVFTTGHGGVFQPDILVGTIDSVDKGALASEALIRPAVDFADLGAVFVVLTEES
ncbi:MAG: rod shape-determining protein MreC [Luteolibacter sp.]